MLDPGLESDPNPNYPEILGSRPDDQLGQNRPGESSSTRHHIDVTQVSDRCHADFTQMHYAGAFSDVKYKLNNIYIL